MNIADFVSACFKPGFTRIVEETTKLNEIQTPESQKEFSQTLKRLKQWNHVKHFQLFSKRLIRKSKSQIPFKWSNSDQEDLTVLIHCIQRQYSAQRTYQKIILCAKDAGFNEYTNPETNEICSITNILDKLIP